MKKSLVITSLLALLLAACSSTPTTAPVEPAKPAAAPAAPAPAKPAAAPAAAKPGPFDPSNLTNPNSLLSKRSVYFEFDKYDIQLDYWSLLEAHGRFLKANPDYRTLIQGNTDERGSREYNLALGQKRAEAVKENLKLIGATDAQIEAVSLGEDKPRALGKDEAAWAENRRADILYKNSKDSAADFK
ncbi:MAG: peptidoglycan-associated lipoprotein [Candidatus Dactylopiibacterium carminicum]|uniref:Peptidoglycan-associated lipoprotein n=1 Tax=Candidatus Dactylopiibacterium carminicum TaxID=857335 RepID=A0A272EQM1_9RHOO|nr:peptidoglycan-associated lipoprotein Pal [Candidatus Dactylopiibacterium carminicum]KAF7598647.1 peptidoglycan-associated lipoprotein [Candidatus Dactylopiibacterium carminicum]PAS92413.1 MAG: peptidoglycan-associated lipoprotein [Candidatus Dactylopiibacterium carminicum]PAS95994.1 MAG: peptidoglycan-associated lipoprotein [Candidatus Dactylopiibacterium carminicum]PAS98414.1 MAG: peptidoglycan-associated lipoprotein [Candidatus Dactylopiibacterium carminicum]